MMETLSEEKGCHGRARQMLRQAAGRVALSEGPFFWYDVGRRASRVSEHLTADILARSFAHVVSVQPGASVSRDSPSHSKVFGHPHMPSAWKRPRHWGDYRFLMQLDASEIAGVDRQRRLPDRGLICIFQHTDLGFCRLVYFPEITPDFVERRDLLPLEDREERPLSFNPGWILYVAREGDEDYGRIASSLPADVRENVNELLGCEMLEADPDFRLFGRPRYYRGEDAELEEIDDGDAILLLHMPLNTTSLHIWIDPANLKVGDVSGAWEDIAAPG